jgi:hypothetical protein
MRTRRKIDATLTTSLDHPGPPDYRRILPTPEPWLGLVASIVMDLQGSIAIEV